MAGRGHPQQPTPTQPPACLMGQGNHPPLQANRTAASATSARAQAGRSEASPASVSAQALAEVNRQQPRGRWGDGGVNAYGDGQHRGSSSSGGGRGYGWKNNGGGSNGFNAPPGKSVLGISGPPNPKRGGFQQNWGDRGGGRMLKPPLPPHDAPAEKDGPNKATVNEAIKDMADPIPVDQNIAIGKGEGARTPPCGLLRDAPLQAYYGEPFFGEVDDDHNARVRRVRGGGERLGRCRQAKSTTLALAPPILLPLPPHRRRLEHLGRCRQDKSTTLALTPPAPPPGHAASCGPTYDSSSLSSPPPTQHPRRSRICGRRPPLPPHKHGLLCQAELCRAGRHPMRARRRHYLLRGARGRSWFRRGTPRP
ncbi:hypothetical protein ZWY2020_004583 [Hordeum vulgare]|nr:hypothetical protein ZWY2020_004583 [Hordeum vulgare]